MNYGVILAGGVGQRMTGLKIPKQFYVIDGYPLIYYTMHALYDSNIFDNIIIACVPEYKSQIASLIKNNFTDYKKFIVVDGGSTRLASIDSVTDYISQNYKINDDDIILIHDAARPFVTKDILYNSVEIAKVYGATVAVLPATDTMLFSKNGKKVDEIPDRSCIFHGQAPDTFLLSKYLKMRKNISPEDLNKITGTSQICTLNNQDIYMVSSDPLNFKVTTMLDLEIAKSIIKSRREENK